MTFALHFNFDVSLYDADFNTALTTALQDVVPYPVEMARVRTANNSYFCYLNSYRRKLLTASDRSNSTYLIFDAVIGESNSPYSLQ